MTIFLDIAIFFDYKLLYNYAIYFKVVSNETGVDFLWKNLLLSFPQF